MEITTSKQNNTLQNENYKQTELGPLPQEWEVVRLGEVIIPDREKIKAKDYSGKEKIVEKISFDRGVIVFRDKNKTATDLFKVDKERLLISKINFHQGAVAITPDTTVATTHYDIYKVLENSNILYLWYYFRSDAFKKLFAEEIKFRGYKKEANFQFIKDFTIPPPAPFRPARNRCQNRSREQGYRKLPGTHKNLRRKNQACHR
ncbi:restriction endonuclease subunit S [Thermospira aquatica]|uniref:Restriction endonuclease subunit S n=1 Tax=Thermospira aquatica TaxID=2828656 RepID=A0AAX3BE75_9SPIR|nr:restriction endonuclease subunit S [Thermospira aquatica]URA10642.1 restriction endonuclease subunit S [Thermospira aquatica]